MQKGVVVPSSVQAVLEKPGKSWTGEEVKRVTRWLYEPVVLKTLLHFSLYALGTDATVEEVEDALATFLSRRLGALIRLYDPARGRLFWNYLLLCLERYCWDESERLRKRHHREPSLEPAAGSSSEGLDDLEWRFEGNEPGPDETLERKELLLLLQRCIDALPLMYHRVVVLHYFADEPVQEISEEVGLSVVNVKVRLFRARQKLAECLGKAGAMS